jgi:uncharacterized protein (DUF924 family)
MDTNAQNVIDFWFIETVPELWFKSSAAFDEAICSRFARVYEMARSGELKDWRDYAQGCLALCLILDQFPRNMFRGQAKAFATDNHALEVSNHALEQGYDKQLPAAQKSFLYMPFMHSENLADQARSVALFETLKNDNPAGYEHALRHQREIEMFGRFPYRNDALGRKTTDEEQHYLDNLSL